MVQIIPAILATSEEQYQADLNKLSSAQALQNGWVHIDFADNIFVQNKTIEPEAVLKFPTNFRKQAHLMVIRPREWIDRLVKAGFESIIFHIEAEEVAECIGEIKENDLEVGLAINKETPIEKLLQFVDKIDIILVMAIVPGFQGQSLIPETLDKVKMVKAKNWPVKVGVDGAVKDTDIKQVVDTGLDFVIVGSYLLKGDTEENLGKLWEVLNG